MAKTLDEMMQQLPSSRRQNIETRAKELINEQMTLSDIRKARSLTQERIADLLGIRQDSVSKLEKRTDLLLSTLRSYVKAMGGELRLIVEFPDRPPLVLTGLSELDQEKSAQSDLKSINEQKNKDE